MILLEDKNGLRISDNSHWLGDMEREREGGERGEE